MIMPPVPRIRTSAFAVVFLTTILALGLLPVDDAQADYNFPRLGLSAARDDYVDQMSCEMGDTFTVYVGAFGTESGSVLEEDLVSLLWVVHQVCCGGDLVVVDYSFVGDFVSNGHPLGGVTSVAPSCVSADFMPLAELTVMLVTPDGPGEYQMSAGPYGPSVNCVGDNPIFLEGVVNVAVGGEITPVVGTSWSGLKAFYR
jgi:hypothetical protein